MIKTKAIDHVCLWVTSRNEAKAYYEDVFGFKCVARKGDNKTLVVESEHVHFFICESSDMSQFVNKQHISFNVNSLDDVVAVLLSKGITDYQLGETDCFSDKNYKWCEWRDPCGIRLECVELI